MIVLRALMYGLSGGYLALALLVAAAVLSKADDRAEAAAFLEKARWLPGAARIEMAIFDSRAASGGAASTTMAPKLTELQKLRARTYGGSGHGEVAPEGN